MEKEEVTMGWEEKRNKIVEQLKGEAKTVVLAGGVGIGKTWMAREAIDHIDRQLFYGPLWINKNEDYEKDGDESLSRDIAFQLYVPEEDEDEDGRKKKPEDLKVYIHESLYRGIAFKLSVPVNDQKKGLEGLKDAIGKKGKAIFILVILDDSPTEEYEEKVVRKLEGLVYRPEKYEKEVEKKLGLGYLPEDNGKEAVKRLVKEAVSLKILVTRSDKWQEASGSSSKKDVVTIDASSVLDSKVHKEVLKRDDFKEIRDSIRSIEVVPAVFIALIAEALNKSHNSWVSKFKNALQESKEGKEKEERLLPLLRCCIDMLESVDKSLVNCYWYMWEFFRNNGAIRHNDLIVSWILEGLVGSDDPVEEAFKEGHRVLMMLVDYGVLKMQEANLVSFESSLLADGLKDWRLERYERTSTLGLARAFQDGSWQRLQLIPSTKEKDKDKDKDKDKKKEKEKEKETEQQHIPSPETGKEETKTTGGTPPATSKEETKNTGETPSPATSKNTEQTGTPESSTEQEKDTQGKNIADEGFTLLIDGSRFFREKPESFFEKKPRLHALAIFNPTFQSLLNSKIDPPPQSQIPSTLTKTLSILVLRGCDQLKNIEGIQSMESLTVLEISGATKLKNIPPHPFEKMKKLRSLVLRGLLVTELPSELSDLTELRWLILRECTEFKELPRLKKLKHLQVLNLSGSTSFSRVLDKHFSHLESLQLFDFSNTGIKRLPLLGDHNVTQVLLRGCTSLTRLPFFEGLKRLQYLTLSGSTQLKEITRKFPGNKEHLKILDLSNTKISSLPANFNEIKNVERLDLSGATYLSDIHKDTFKNMNCLSHLNLSKTKLESLPETSGLTSLEELDLSNVSSLTKFTDHSLDHLGCLRRLNLSGCGNLSQFPELEKALEKLEFLDLSGTKIESLPKLDNMSNLRELKLRSCEKLTSLPGLKSLTKLEVLDLWGAGITKMPPEIHELSCLKHLDLPIGIQNVDQELIKKSKKKEEKKDGGVEVNWDECGIFEGREAPDYMVVKGTDFFENFRKHPELWEDIRFKKFHFSVSPRETEGGGEDRYWHEIDLKFKKIYFLTRHIPHEEDGRYLEILGFDKFPSGVEEALKRAQYVSLIENRFIKKLSDLRVENVNAMKGCWLERCTEMTTIFWDEVEETKMEVETKMGKETKTREEEAQKRLEEAQKLAEESKKMTEHLEIVWVSDLPILKTVCSKGTQPWTFKKLKEMYIEYCPQLEEVLVCSLLPQNLKVLHVKFCEKLKWLFILSTPVEDPKLPKLETLHLVQLPALETIDLPPEPKRSIDPSPSQTKTATDPSPSKASRDPSAPTTSTDPSPSKASRDPSAPKTSTDPSPTKASTDPSPPKASSDPPPKPSTDPPPPNPSPPEASADPSPSKASTDPSPPETSTDPSTSKALSDPPPPKPSTDPSPPNLSPPEASPDPSPSKASTDPTPPETSMDPSTSKASSDSPPPPKPSTDPTPPVTSTDPSTSKASSDPDPSPSKASTDPTPPPKPSTDPSPLEASSDPSLPEAPTDPSPPEASSDPSPSTALTDPSAPKASTDPSPLNPSSDPSQSKASTDPSPPKASSDPSPPSKTLKDLFPALRVIKCQNCPKLKLEIIEKELGLSVGDMLSE